MARILIIDDDEGVSAVLATHLRKRGHTAIIAEDGKRGIKAQRAENPDLIITDIVMPDMDGIEVVSHVRRTAPKLPIIAMSGASVDELYLKTARALGATQTFTKPFRPEVLVDTVDQLLVASA